MNCQWIWFKGRTKLKLKRFFYGTFHSQHFTFARVFGFLGLFIVSNININVPKLLDQLLCYFITKVIFMINYKYIINEYIVIKITIAFEWKCWDCLIKQLCWLDLAQLNRQTTFLFVVVVVVGWFVDEKFVEANLFAHQDFASSAEILTSLSGTCFFCVKMKFNVIR